MGKDVKRKICKAGGCNETARARGHCPRHYTQIRKYGHLTPGREHRRLTACQADGCEGKPKAGGYCPKHDQQIRRHGRLTPEREILTAQRTCRMPGCDKKHAAHGMCKTHYMRQYSRGRSRQTARLRTRAAG